MSSFMKIALGVSVSLYIVATGIEYNIQEHKGSVRGFYAKQKIKNDVAKWSFITFILFLASIYKERLSRATSIMELLQVSSFIFLLAVLLFYLGYVWGDKLDD